MHVLIYIVSTWLLTRRNNFQQNLHGAELMKVGGTYIIITIIACMDAVYGIKHIMRIIILPQLAELHQFCTWSSCRHLAQHFLWHSSPQAVDRARRRAVIAVLPFLCLRSYPSKFQYYQQALLYRFRYRAYCWNCCRLARPHCLTMVVISRRSSLSSYSFYFNCSHSVCCCHLVVLILSLTDP